MRQYATRILGLALVAGGWLDGTAAPAAIIYVDAGAAAGADTGADWPDAFSDLQSALDAAQAGDEVWVAAGKYVPSEPTYPDKPRSATFYVTGGLTLRGGFFATPGSEGDPDARDPDAHTNNTVLSGDLAGDDVGGIDDPSRADNAYCVVIVGPETSSAGLDGLTITGGNAGAGGGTWGGGIHAWGRTGSSLTMTHCVLKHNRATGRGGGMYTDLHQVTLSHCDFIENHSEANAGGLDAEHLVAVNLEDCSFIRNTADRFGGAMLSSSVREMNVTRCTFEGNVAEEGAGAWWITVHHSVVVTGCTFTGNTTPARGGAVTAWDYSEPEKLLFSDTQFIENQSGEEGGAVYFHNELGVTRRARQHKVLWHKHLQLARV